MKPRVVLLATRGEHLDIAYNYLKEHFDITEVIVEDALSKKKMLQYRLKKLGFVAVFGQVLFIIFSKFLAKISQPRKKKLGQELELDYSSIPESVLTSVSSVNTKACRKALKNADADFVFVIGTRIIGKRTLESVTIPFVNSHAGITPKYRGVHGGYWALAKNDRENCGVTLHYVDTGVDTGDIIAQELISPEKKDNFITYPILQQHAGLELLVAHTQHILNRKPGVSRTDLASKQWFHPTLWEYMFCWLIKGIN